MFLKKKKEESSFEGNDTIRLRKTTEKNGSTEDFIRMMAT